MTLANLLGVYGVLALRGAGRDGSTVHEPRAVSIDDELLRTMPPASSMPARPARR